MTRLLARLATSRTLHGCPAQASHAEQLTLLCRPITVVKWESARRPRDRALGHFCNATEMVLNADHASQIARTLCIELHDLLSKVGTANVAMVIGADWKRVSTQVLIAHARFSQVGGIRFVAETWQGSSLDTGALDEPVWHASAIRMRERLALGSSKCSLSSSTESDREFTPPALLTNAHGSRRGPGAPPG